MSCLSRSGLEQRDAKGQRGQERNRDHRTGCRVSHEWNALDHCWQQLPEDKSCADDQALAGDSHH
jgi:hypothetical protein